MTLNSIYSLVFAVKSEKGDGAVVGNGGLSSPIAKALSSASSDTDDVYTIMINNEPSLRLLSCNTLKHSHARNPNSQSDVEVYTLLSSPKFGKQFKGPQENLPPELMQKVVMKMLLNLEQSLGLKSGSIVGDVVDAKLQLWGAAVPMNTWSSSSISTGTADGFVYDAKHACGAAGDWILDPSIAGAWESGRRLANWMLTQETSVGLPSRSRDGSGGKFVPSRIALSSGIGTIPPSPNSTFEFPSNNKPPNQRSKSPRRDNGNGSNNRRRNSNKGRRQKQVAPQ